MAVTKQRKAYLKYHYKLTPEQYIEMSKNGCQVCGGHDRLQIDHDHRCCPIQRSSTGSRYPTCGKCVRGILCHHHNLAEGHLHSDPAEAILLIKYMCKDMGVEDKQNLKSQLLELLTELDMGE